MNVFFVETEKDHRIRGRKRCRLNRRSGSNVQRQLGGETHRGVKHSGQVLKRGSKACPPLRNPGKGGGPTGFLPLCTDRVWRGGRIKGPVSSSHSASTNPLWKIRGDPTAEEAKLRDAASRWIPRDGVAPMNGG